jgi:hypothetical protein
MKLIKLLLLSSSLVSLLIFSNCGGDKKPVVPIPDQQLEKLSKTWRLTSVTLDGTPVTTPSYAGFQLTITGTKGAASFGYTTTGRPSLSSWKSSGTWTFGTDPVTMIIRDADNTADRLDINYTVTDTNLELRYNFQGNGYPARTDQVKGNWIFNFAL